MYTFGAWRRRKIRWGRRLCITCIASDGSGSILLPNCSTRSTPRGSGNINLKSWQSQPLATSQEVCHQSLPMWLKQRHHPYSCQINAASHTYDWQIKDPAIRPPVKTLKPSVGASTTGGAARQAICGAWNLRCKLPGCMTRTEAAVPQRTTLETAHLCAQALPIIAGPMSQAVGINIVKLSDQLMCELICRGKVITQKAERRGM